MRRPEGEGWRKANKLEGRRAKERLISLFVGDKAAVMVEVSRSHSLNEILSLILLDAVCIQYSS